MSDASTQHRRGMFAGWYQRHSGLTASASYSHNSVDDGYLGATNHQFGAFGEAPTVRSASSEIWKDANSNGVADAWEGDTLQAAGSAANETLYRRCA